MKVECYSSTWVQPRKRHDHQSLFLISAPADRPSPQISKKVRLWSTTHAHNILQGTPAPHHAGTCTQVVQVYVLSGTAPEANAAHHGAMVLHDRIFYDCILALLPNSVPIEVDPGGVWVPPPVGYCSGFAGGALLKLAGKAPVGNCRRSKQGSPRRSI